MLLFNVLVVIYFILGFYICGQAGKRTKAAKVEVERLEELIHEHNLIIADFQHKLYKSEECRKKLENEVDELKSEIFVIYRFTE